MQCNKEVKNTASQNDLQMCYQIYAVMLMKNLFQIGPSPKLPLSLDMCKLVLSWSQQPYNHQFRVCWYKVKIDKSSPFTVALITQLISKFIWIDFFHHHHTCDSTFIPNAVSTTDYDKTQQWVLKTKPNVPWEVIQEGRQNLSSFWFNLAMFNIFHLCFQSLPPL